jgi:methionyl-tRNA formyltransferase
MITVVFLGLNRLGEQVYQWLIEREDADVLCLITEPSQYPTIEALEPKLIVSAGHRSIVPNEILGIPELGAVNLHPSYLPYNRGANSNVWSILKDDMAGVSIHYMTTEVDAGPIIGRSEVPVYPEDTGDKLYQRLETELFDLFVETWPSIRDGTVDAISQENGSGTHFYKEDFTNLFEINLEKETTAGDFLNRLRALTFPPYTNAYFEKDGEKYYVEVKINPDSEVSETESIHWKVPDYTDE